MNRQEVAQLRLTDGNELQELALVGVDARERSPSSASRGQVLRFIDDDECAAMTSVLGLQEILEAAIERKVGAIEWLIQRQRDPLQQLVAAPAGYWR